MRKLCPNFDREDGLETVLEVPIPEEMFSSAAAATNSSSSSSSHHISLHNYMKSWIRPSSERSSPPSLTALFGGRNTEIQLLLGVIGAPLIPLPVSCEQPINRDIRDYPIEASMAKYIVQQYVAAVGGEGALNSIDSMCVIGKVRMGTSELMSGEGVGLRSKKTVKVKNNAAIGEMGGFVLWQKRPELWCLELVVSGCKISAGSDGKVAWRQTPWHNSHASRGPPRPLRRLLQGVDPRSTANLFSNSICIGEKTINDEDCFILKLEAESSALRARSSRNVQIIRHTIWGYFSQRTGLLVNLEDSHLLRIKSSRNESIFWETSMQSLILDYRTIDGINIAHAGKTSVSLFRFGDCSEPHTRTRMEEVWEIEEVDFNIKGLSMDCFLPPGDLKKEEQGCKAAMDAKTGKLPFSVRNISSRISASKIAAISLADDEDDDDDL